MSEIFFKRVYFLIVVKLLFLVYSSSAQEKNSGYASFHASCPEKRWALFHPFAARKIYKAAIAARDGVIKVKNDSLLDSRNNGGMLDAFRHTYWMALSSQKVKEKKAIRFGKVHERGNFKMFKKLQYEEGELPDSISCAMDLFNNKIGAAIGCENKHATKDFLMQLIISKIKAGEMKIVSIDCSGNYIDCEHQPIDMKKFNHQWKNTKCLVNSNEGCYTEK